MERLWSDKIEIPAGTTSCPAWLKDADAVRIWTTGDDVRDGSATRPACEWMWDSRFCRITHASRLLDEGWMPASTMPRDGTRVRCLWVRTGEMDLFDGTGMVAERVHDAPGLHAVLCWRPANSTQPAAPEVVGEGWIKHDGKGLPEAARNHAKIDARRADGSEAIGAPLDRVLAKFAELGSASPWYGGRPRSVTHWRPHVEEKAAEAKPVPDFYLCTTTQTINYTDPQCERDTRVAFSNPIIYDIPSTEAKSSMTPTLDALESKSNPDRRMLVLDRWGERKATRAARAEADRQSYAFFAERPVRDGRLLCVAPLSRFHFDQEN